MFFLKDLSLLGGKNFEFFCDSSRLKYCKIRTTIRMEL